MFKTGLFHVSRTFVQFKCFRVIKQSLYGGLNEQIRKLGIRCILLIFFLHTFSLEVLLMLLFLPDFTSLNILLIIYTISSKVPYISIETSQLCTSRWVLNDFLQEGKSKRLKRMFSFQLLSGHTRVRVLSDKNSLAEHQRVHQCIQSVICSEFLNEVAIL